MVVEVEPEQDLCLVQVVPEDLRTQPELQEMVAVGELVLIKMLLLEVVVLEPLVKMALEH